MLVSDFHNDDDDDSAVFLEYSQMVILLDRDFRSCIS